MTLKEWMDRSGISIGAASRMMNINKFTIRKALAGRKLSKIKNIRKISRFTGGAITVDDLRTNH